MIDDVFGDDDKQGQVDGVDAFAKDGPLPPALAPSIRALSARGTPGHPGSCCSPRPAPASGWEPVFRRREHRHSRFFPAAMVTSGNLWMRYCQRQIKGVNAAAQEIGLVSRFAMHGNDVAFGDGTAIAPQLFDHANAVIWDVANAQRTTRSTKKPIRTTPVTINPTGSSVPSAKVTE